MICVAPVLVDGVTYLTVESQTAGCTLGVLLAEADATFINSFFAMPSSAAMGTAFWHGFQLVAWAYLIGWGFGAVLNFLKEK